MELRWNGSNVELLVEGNIVARARWREGALVERVGALTQAQWTEIEEAVRRDAVHTIATTFAAAYDQRGVDVVQIDRMLARSPRERLEALDASRRTILELTQHARRD